MVVWGDFNEVLFHSEKRGGNRKSKTLLNNFRNCLSECELFDCGFSGYPFTWANNYEEGLNRFVANPGWSSLFPKGMVQHDEAISSDHCPISVQCLGPVKKRRKKKVFRFEAMWTREFGCDHILRNEWRWRDGDSATDRVNQNLQACSNSLADWDKTVFGIVHVELEVLRKEVKILEKHKDRPGNRSLLKITKE